jgi:hypothetical protein
MALEPWEAVAVRAEGQRLLPGPAQALGAQRAPEAAPTRMQRESTTTHQVEHGHVPCGLAYLGALSTTSFPWYSSCVGARRAYAEYAVLHVHVTHTAGQRELEIGNSSVARNQDILLMPTLLKGVASDKGNFRRMR